MTDANELTDADQVALRGFFRHHFQDRVAFNKACGVRITAWQGDDATFELDLRDDLTAHPGVFHGGVVSALIDTAGTGAVVAGHDFTRGSRVTTVSLAVNYLSVAPGEGIVAEARCTRRGRSNHYAEVHVYGVASRKLVAQGLVTCNITGVRDGFDQILAAARRGTTSPGTIGASSLAQNAADTL
ncbi:MAG: PaaI family thioesterase [Acidimicrobiia bacterium]